MKNYSHNAYVGVHKGVNNSVSTLSNKDLRELQKD